MNLKKIRNTSAFLLTAGLLTAVPAAASDSMWPDLQDINKRLQETAEAETETEEKEAEPPFLSALRDHPYTAQELEDLFGDLPPYTDYGAFTFHELNQLPIASFGKDGTAVLSSNGCWLLRRTWESLQEELSEKLDGYQGDWAVYVKDLTSGQVMEINEHSMESASLIKLYIAGATYELIEQGMLEENDTISSALDAMITVSDNESANVLVRAMCSEGEDFQDGLAIVNDFIQRYGFTNTEQINGIADPSLWVDDGRVNMTSAADCGRFLELVYEGKLVSHYTSMSLEALLERQEINYKIPDALPSDVHLAHKTGEVSDTENDAAILYTPYGDFIYTILSTGLTDTNAAVDHIHEITSLIYKYIATPPAARICRVDGSYTAYVPFTDAKYTDLSQNITNALVEWAGDSIPQYTAAEYQENEER